FGEGEDDQIDDNLAVAGIPNPGATLDIIDYGAGDGATPTSFVIPSTTPNPTVQPPGNGITYGASSLPTGAGDLGRWAELSGSASGRGLSGDAGLSSAPSVAISPTGPVVAWADSRNGNLE